jgi:hypothetical protein
MKVLSVTAACDQIQKLMSPFIDSMATPEEAGLLHSHMDECERCRRQLQSFISIRNLIAGIQPVKAPEDLVLETRVRLSHERTRNDYDRWYNRLDNVLRPLFVPAVLGVTVTLFCFGILSGSLIPNQVVLADRVEDGGPTIATYQPVQTIERLGSQQSPALDQPLSIATEISDAGRIFDYRIISGTRSPAVDQWVQEMLLLARFRPATSWGTPVPSRIILSFVHVRS